MKTKPRNPWLGRLLPYSLPIQRRLPLLICVLLLVLISSFTIVSYLGIKRNSVETARDRLQTVSGQLASMLEQSSRMLISRTRMTGEKEEIKRFLLSKSELSSPEALNELEKLRNDSVAPMVVLLNANKETVLVSSRKDFKVNRDINGFLLDALHSPEQSMVGNFIPIQDTAYFPVISVIHDQQNPIGFLVIWRKVTSNPNSAEGISKLLGSDASLYFGNTDGSFWTDMVKPAPKPPIHPNEFDKVIEYSRPNNKKVFAVAKPLANTKWIMLVEFPRTKVLEAANKFLYWLMGIGSILIVIGSFLAWLMSRNITRPLNRLTSASSAVAAGDYSAMVSVERADELGKLALAFNAMAARVRESQESLEKKANDYKILFERNPMPMWIACPESMNIVAVNEAAIRHYGYTRDEFLKLNSKDLSPKEDSKQAKINEEFDLRVWRHRMKNGKSIFVEIIADEIIYQDKPARIVLANDITKRIKAEVELARQAKLQQKLITETSIEVQEREREEIGKELHDNINQILASTKLFLGLALEDEKNVSPELLKKSHQNIRMAMEEIRQLSQTLVAPSLGDITLVDAIKELASNIKLGSAIKIDVKQENYNETAIDNAKKLMLYRIIQEQMNNILKHSQAKHATIHLTTSSNDIILKIEDDGIGFDPQKKSGGIGLRNMANRAGFYNGKIDILSTPGRGCTLVATVPIMQEDKFFNKSFPEIFVQSVIQIPADALHKRNGSVKLFLERR